MNNPNHRDRKLIHTYSTRLFHLLFYHIISKHLFLHCLYQVPWYHGVVLNIRNANKTQNSREPHKFSDIQFKMFAISLHFTPNKLLNIQYQHIQHRNSSSEKLSDKYTNTTFLIYQTQRNYSGTCLPFEILIMVTLMASVLKLSKVASSDSSQKIWVMCVTLIFHLGVVKDTVDF